MAWLRPALRLGRAGAARERTRFLDHAGQGEPHAMRGADDGLRAGDGQRRRHWLRRLAGQLRIERLQTGHDFQLPQFRPAASRRLSVVRRALRERPWSEPRAHRGLREALPDAGDGAEPEDRLRQRGEDCQDRAQRRHDPARSHAQARVALGGGVRSGGHPRAHDATVIVLYRQSYAWRSMGGGNGPQMLGRMSKYSSSSFLPPSPLPRVFSVSTNSMRSIHFTIL